MNLLDKIDNTHDLKALDPALLPELAGEIREFIISTVSRTGGHLASNLGAVELTLALHKVFECPRDKIIWDVGHQSYTHKILTGRKENFKTLRQFGGISGFPARAESESDAFGTGHASTSISAALGMAAARDLKKENFNVVAVIGDGSLTGGMAFEALNNAGELKKRLLVVLNDNEMSIAKNVGALAEYLYRMRTGATYKRIKRDIDAVLKSIPSVGDRMLRTVDRVKNSLKFLLVPGMLFEELGLNYFGPVDGHDIAKMVEVFESAKNFDKPTVVHVLTCKGKGYTPAELKTVAFHGTGPFKIETGDKETDERAITYTEAFSETILELAEKDRRITAITAAMPDGTGLSAFCDKYPDRFFDVGIAEQHAVTMAAGMACEGMRPVVAIYSTFAQRAYDQLLHDVCLQNLPVVFAFDRTGLVGDDGATHHGVFSFSFLRSLPNIIIFVPKDENELQAMIRTAFTIDGPAAVFYPRGQGGGEPRGNISELPIGRAEQMRSGRGVALWAIGSMVGHGKKVCDKLAAFGIEAGLVNARFVKPLDRELLKKTANDYEYIVTLEENMLAGGFGSAVLEELQAAGILDRVKTLSLGVPDRFVPHGNKDALFKSLRLDADALAERIAAFCRA